MPRTAGTGDCGAPQLGRRPTDRGRLVCAERGHRRSIRLLPDSKRQFAKPSLHPIRLDIREVLSIHTRCALVERHWA
jgi:hypothetical protein